MELYNLSLKYLSYFFTAPNYTVNNDSGYGNNMIWAPWQSYHLASPFSNGAINNNFSGGTSYAAAFTSGVIAQMLSRNPGLTNKEIESILYNGMGRPINQSQNMGSDVSFTDRTSLRLIDANNAVRRAIESIKPETGRSKIPSDYEAKQKGLGLFELNPGALNNNSTNNKKVGKLRFNNGSIIDVLRTASDEEFKKADGKISILRGWESSVTGFEVLNLVELPKNINTTPTITNVIPNLIVDKATITIKGYNIFSTKNQPKLIFKNGIKAYEYVSSSKINNEGTEISFSFNKAEFKEIDSSGNYVLGPHPLIPAGNYSILIKTEMGDSNEFNSSFSNNTQANGFTVSSSTLPSNITLGTKSVAVITSESKTQVVNGDKIAIPLNSDLKERLGNISFYAGGRQLTYLDVVNEYAILGIDTTIPQGASDVFIKNLTGDTILTFEQALYKTAIAIGLKPIQPVSFPDGSSLSPDKFIDNNSNIQVKSGDIVGVALRGDLANISISLGGKSATLQSIVDDYVSFKIPPDIATGAQDVIIGYTGGNITFKDALEVLATNPNIAKNNKIAISGD